MSKTSQHSRTLQPEQEAIDFLGHPIKIGDTVSFPAGGELGTGKVTKLGILAKGFRSAKSAKPRIIAITIKNKSGYTKSKDPINCINISLIKDTMIEYRL